MPGKESQQPDCLGIWHPKLTEQSVCRGEDVGKRTVQSKLGPLLDPRQAARCNGHARGSSMRKTYFAKRLRAIASAPKPRPSKLMPRLAGSGTLEAVGTNSNP